MNKDLIPSGLHYLIHLVERWGIEDDGYRDEAIEKASTSDLQELVNSINDENADELDKWFCNSKMLSNPNEEYIKYSVFFMAYEYAKAVLKSRMEDRSEFL